MKLRASLPVACLAPAFVITFLTIANMAFLSQPLRLGTMAGIAALLGATVLFSLHKKMPTPTLFYIFMILFSSILIFYHNRDFPSLTEYSDSKRIYFFFSFFACGLIIPMALRSRANLRFFVTGLVLYSLLFSLLAFTNGSTGSVRRSGIELNPALHSKIVLFPALLLIAYDLKFRQHVWLTAAVVLGVMGCVATGSRGALAILVLTFIVDRFKGASIKEILKAVTLMFLAFVSFLLLLDFFPSDITERFTIESLTSQSDEGDRFYLYALGLELFRQSITGLGMGNFSAFFWIAAPHNIIIEALVELGIVVGTVFLTLIIATGFRALSYLRDSDPLNRFYALFFIFMLGNSMIGGEMSFPSFMLYIVMGILWLSNLRNMHTTPALET